MTDDEATPLYKRIQQALALSIETGELSSGQRLTESQLARHFSVSREPARRALRGLNEKGLVKSVSGGRGFLVRGQKEHAHSGYHDAVAPLAGLSGLGQVRRTVKWAEKYDAIKADLLAVASHGDFKIVPAGLAEKYQISRTVLRDIQVRLIADGFVRLDGQKWLLNRFDEKAVSDHYEVRMQLEPYALNQGFSRIDRTLAEACLNHLLEANANIDLLTVEQLETLEVELHDKMLSSCGNAYLMEVLRQSRLVHIFNSYYFLRFKPNNLFTEEHIDVFEGIIKGDAAAATRALLGHLDNSKTDTQIRLSKFAADHSMIDTSCFKQLPEGR